jgi:hypothetical protein
LFEKNCLKKMFGAGAIGHARVLACWGADNRFQFLWEGGDNRVLWLSFTQQKI